MVYSIEGRDFAGALITADGVVLYASRDFEWACGEPIAPVLEFLERQRVRWTVSEALPHGLVLEAGVPQWVH